MLEMLNTIFGFFALAITILIERKRIYAAILEILQDFSKPKYVSVVQSQNQDTAQDTVPRKVKKTGVSIFSTLALFFKTLIAIAGSSLSLGLGVVWLESSLWLKYILSKDSLGWLEATAMLCGVVFGAVFLRKKSWAMVILLPMAFVFWNYIIAFNMGIFRSILIAILGL